MRSSCGPGGSQPASHGATCRQRRAGISSPRQRVAWLLLAAVLLGALAPTVSRWLAGSNAGTGWVEVCTATGVNRVPADGSAPESPAHAALGEHCGYCRLQADLPFVLPAPPAQPVGSGTWTQRLSAAASPEPRAEAFWPCQLSRAPPQVS